MARQVERGGCELYWIWIDDSEIGSTLGEGGWVHDVELDLATQLYGYLPFDFDEALLKATLSCIPQQLPYSSLSTAKEG